MKNLNPNKILNNMFKNNNILKKIIIFIIIILLILFVCIYVIKNIIYPVKYFDVIKNESKKNNIDPYLILSIIKTESNFNVLATSKKNAKGLMQITDLTAKEVIKDLNIDNIKNKENIDIYNEKINITIGCNYLKKLINKYNGNYYLAICAYNAGMGNVDKWIKDGKIPNNLNEYKNISIPFKETENYLYKVISSYNMYKKIYN